MSTEDGTVTFSDAPASFKCPDCGAVSYNPSDIQQRYCGRCHVFHEPPVPDVDGAGDAIIEVLKGAMPGVPPHWRQSIAALQIMALRNAGFGILPVTTDHTQG